MMYNIDLTAYRSALEKMVMRKEITQDTANTYYSCMKVINDCCEKIDPKTLKAFLSQKLKNRKQFMKYVAAIRKYEDKVLKHSKGMLFGEPEVELFKHFKLKGMSSSNVEMKLSEETMVKKINGLRNRKLKYALRLQLKSGLRVSEVSKLKKEDLIFQDGKIEIHVRDGKGRKARDVHALEDQYLYEKLPEYIEESKDDRLFYSRDYLRIKAAEYGIATHDLRRANAKARLETEMGQGKTRVEAKKVVQRELGHELPRVTDLYIGAKVKNKGREGGLK